MTLTVARLTAACVSSRGAPTSRVAAAAPGRRAVTAAFPESTLRLSSARSQHQGLALRQKQTVRAVRCRQAAQSPHASFLGVGAPEAFVVGVVALIVFGPKGLADVAKSVGKTLKSFQPTIQELQSVSREFQSALKDEILQEDKPVGNLVPPSSLQATAAQQAAAAQQVTGEAAKTVPPTLTADAPTPPAASEGTTAPKQ